MPARARDARVVLLTAGSEEQANMIARALVAESLAACVNVIGPIRSIYRWRGAVEEENEYLLLAKTRASLYSSLERRARELHSYEVPEVLALSPHDGSAPYLRWLTESTAKFPRSPRARKRRVS
jgi:periplasmic divalent cation tolerance protein